MAGREKGRVPTEGGSGIGLAQTFRAVQIHNGRIDLATEVGRGTMFTIDLPEA